MPKCKRKGCSKTFKVKHQVRIYGKESIVVLLGYCSAYCYTQNEINQ